MTEAYRRMHWSTRSACLGIHCAKVLFKYNWHAVVKDDALVTITPGDPGAETETEVRKVIRTLLCIM